jgi:hypothetical protein
MTGADWTAADGAGATNGTDGEGVDDTEADGEGTGVTGLVCRDGLGAKAREVPGDDAASGSGTLPDERALAPELITGEG